MVVTIKTDVSQHKTLDLEKTSDDLKNKSEFVDQTFEDSSSENDSSNESSESVIKCSAVHTLERDMPDFDYSHLVDQLRVKILKDIEDNPGLYSQVDIDKCHNDDWFITRFLLRQKLDVDAGFNMLRKAMRFRHESLANHLRNVDFPAEFYKLGGLFSYRHDRKNNKMLYMRIKVHRKVPELQTVLEAFIYHNINWIDNEANGRGIALVIDCTGAGLPSADVETLMCLISCLTNYFPKGFSYVLVHELPWILKPIWHLAKLCIPEEYTQLIKFSNSKTIYEYVDIDQLPDFMGGTCEEDYRKVPENCTTLKEASKLWGIDKATVKKIILRFIDNLPEDTMKQVDELDDEMKFDDKINSET